MELLCEVVLVLNFLLLDFRNVARMTNEVGAQLRVESETGPIR